MSISGRRGQGKSEAGGSVTHCALKRFITPYSLKFRKGDICKVVSIQDRQAACSILVKMDWLIQYKKDEHEQKERPTQIRVGWVTA